MSCDAGQKPTVSLMEPLEVTRIEFSRRWWRTRFRCLASPITESGILSGLNAALETCEKGTASPSFSPSTTEHTTSCDSPCSSSSEQISAMVSLMLKGFTLRTGTLPISNMVTSAASLAILNNLFVCSFATPNASVKLVASFISFICSSRMATWFQRMWQGVLISWKVFRTKMSFALASCCSFSLVTLNRSSRIFLPVSSRMKHRVCLNVPSGFQLTLESISKSLIFPFLSRKRTGTSLIVLPDPRVLKISRTSSFSSGQKFMIGCPMYSSAVYPRMLSSVSLAQSTWPVPLSQCIAIGALFKKSSSSLSEGCPVFSCATLAEAGSIMDILPDIMTCLSSNLERVQSYLLQIGKSFVRPSTSVEQSLIVGVCFHSSRSDASPEMSETGLSWMTFSRAILKRVLSSV
mmetsp:Transcript_37789/g.119377  ORF Transcript_37789/g.119377 Transcript_37789/m.119377 type:complete len:406 (-) Transcript_37789:213-1430(-)